MQRLNAPGERMYRYWGKAQPWHEGQQPYHLLVYHSLDVAAVGQVLLRRHPTLRDRLATSLQIQPEQLEALLIFLLAMHDVGKFAETFQALQPDLMLGLQGRSQLRFEAGRHDSLGFAIWNEVLWPQLQELGWFQVPAERRSLRQWRRVFELFLQPMVGHHGQPPKVRTSASTGFLLQNFFDAKDQAAASSFMDAAADLLLGAWKKEALGSDPVVLWERLSIWSWWLAGFAVLCDWIGSNQDYFHYKADQISLADYYRSFALPRAEQALAATGVLPVASAPAKAIDQLFPYISHPTPLQAAVSELELADGPQLFILEDVTGAGKTEAALMLTHRLMSAGLVEGAYVALPTMATANAMYQRMADSYHQLFVPDANPSLVLAHGARELVDQFRQSVVPAGEASDLSYSAGEDSATAQCSAWLADQRKKALLANVGVGTIDQALLGVLFSRHQSLRLFGLLGKVLVVDEVHACDAYVNRLLRTLLTFHAAAGGSAVLLSATLPVETRAEFAEAFCTGAGYVEPSFQSAAYPLLTHVSDAGVVEKPLATREEVRRKVAVEWASDQADVVRLIQNAAAAGGCVCWIRNTVADALEAMDLLADALPAETLQLFHARFAMGDRLAIEERVLATFGKESTAQVRAGQVLVATQVVEQSLDLDFDLLISDLAPVDLLIQRAGRLHRHKRDAQGNTVSEGVDGRGEACLVIHGPVPDKDVDHHWYKNAFPRGAYVYPDHGRLWLSGHLLQERGGFRMPEDARLLIEGVYGGDALDHMPDALHESHFNAEATALVDASLARQNSLNLPEGYTTPELDWWEDTLTPTRLGDPVSNIRLARWENGEVRPWIREGLYAWQRSEVSVRRALVASERQYSDAEQDAIEAAKEKMPDKGKWSVLVVLSPQEMSDSWAGSALDGEGRPVTVKYNLDTGLQVIAEK